MEALVTLVMRAQEVECACVETVHREVDGREESCDTGKAGVCSSTVPMGS